ncbi:IclR family transcriptional regulator [Paenibacillus sp. MWE-103]|uniref:IclR family transcriptional regulator n=1 Tax=Paenibacillus artemisiicola TaxID=1172618 RepID=A0ABS3W5U8_9BACL|nr:IclR family transcriptional regulator [Paenibacillus artemisiicola]MBO7743669.1 IclR family transcriptional regulator [Paenibacillus artemisiicola]
MPIIQALDRSLKIIDLFDEQNRELKITDISRQMNLHKSTVHSLLKTLQLHGYIDQDEETGKYRLGMRLVEKGQLLLQGLDIRQAARPHLLKLSERTGQTAHLVVLDRAEGVYIDKVEGAKAVIRYSRIGRRVPLHSSAVGKVLAAYQPPNMLARMLSGYSYSRHTPHTIDGEPAFLAELERVRESGIAYDREENEAGVRCAAAPVFDHNGHVAAAISMSTLLSHVDEAMLARFVSLLLEATKQISLHLGYRD